MILILFEQLSPQSEDSFGIYRSKIWWSPLPLLKLPVSFSQTEAIILHHNNNSNLQHTSVLYFQQIMKKKKELKNITKECSVVDYNRDIANILFKML